MFKHPIILALFPLCLHGCMSPRQQAKQHVECAVQLGSAEQWQKAIGACDEALAIDPGYAWALSTRGYYKHKAGLAPANALADLDAALSKGGGYHMYLQRAAVRYKNKMYDGAIADCDQAIRYASAKGYDPDLIEAQRASGKTVVINLGGGLDDYYAQQLKEARDLRNRALKAMEASKLPSPSTTEP